MRHQLELVGGVEGDDVAQPPGALEQIAQAAVGEHALDEVLAQRRIVQPPLFLDRQPGHGFEQRLGEESAAVAHGRSAGAVHPYALHPTARRVLLQHVAAEILLLELLDAAPDVGSHRPGVVAAGLVLEHAEVFSVPHQPHGRPRHAHSHLELRADGQPLDEAPELGHQEVITLVASVPAHGLAEQAGRDADADPGLAHGGGPPSSA